MKLRCLALFLSVVVVLLLASCEFDWNGERGTRTNEVVLGEKAVKLENGRNHIVLPESDDIYSDPVLCTFAIYTPETYPSQTNARYRIQSAEPGKGTFENIGDKDKVTSLASRDAEAELFYQSSNIRYYYLSGDGLSDTPATCKTFYETFIPEYADAFEYVLSREPQEFFGHGYVDADEDGYFSVYLIHDDSPTDENTAGYVYPAEASTKDVFYLNTYCFETHSSTAEDVDYYIENLFTVFAHELYHYLDENERGFGNICHQYFFFEGLATFVASRMEQEMGRKNNYGNLFFEDSYLFHPLAHSRLSEGFSRGDYAVGCDFFAYIWDVYGKEAVLQLIPYTDVVTAVEEVTGEDFKDVYRAFLCSVMGSVGQPVEDYPLFPAAEFYGLDDSWELLAGLFRTEMDYDDPTPFLYGENTMVDVEIAPLGYDVRVWLDNPEELVITAEEGVEVYAFTASALYLGYLNGLSDHVCPFPEKYDKYYWD